jgi:uncharacterized membrane protein YkvA (DUF1232 family)
MNTFFGLLSVMAICLSLLIAMVIVVAHLPNSPVRTFLVQVCGWATTALCGAAILSPIDPIPDVFFPLGFADDLIFAFIAWKSAKAAWNAGKSKPVCRPTKRGSGMSSRSRNAAGAKTTQVATRVRKPRPEK